MPTIEDLSATLAIGAFLAAWLAFTADCLLGTRLTRSVVASHGSVTARLILLIIACYGVGMFAERTSDYVVSLDGERAPINGGIYLMLAGAPRALGFVTPVGGVLLIGAWLTFAVTMLRR